MPDLTGKTIGRYHILEQIGQGGMATVYKAKDTRLEREVAIKVIRTGLFGREVIERILKRFEREAKALARLDHPNIIRVYDYGEFEQDPYLVMQYVPSGTLKERTGKAIPWREAVELLLPVARALAYAHQEGVLHRDVKPSNILLARSGGAVLTDFGIAKILDLEEGQTLTGTGLGVGTPEYMAPEQGLGKEVDARADVYALGVVLFELVTGRKPYTADTPMEVIIRHVNDPLPEPHLFVPGLPREVENVLVKALAKQPGERYKDMGAFIQALEGLQSTESAPVIRPEIQIPVLPRATKPSKEETALNPAVTSDNPVIHTTKISETDQPKQQQRPPVEWLPWFFGLILPLILVTYIFGSVVKPVPISPKESPESTTGLTPDLGEKPVPITPTESPEATTDLTPNLGVRPVLVIPKESALGICQRDEYGCAVIPDGETIKIGMGGPMTGDYAMFGIDISQGAQIAINDQTGIDKWKFELVANDTQGSPEAGAAVANKFVSDPTVVAIAGHIFSGESEAAMPIYEKAGIPMLSASATNPPLTTLGSKVFNRIAFTDATQSADSAAFMYNKLGVKNLAVMHDGGIYSQGLADLVQAEFEKLGGTVVAYEAVTPGGTDFSAILSAVADKKPEAIYFGGFIGEAIVIVNQMAQSGLGGVTFFGCDGTFGAEFIEKTGANGEGAYAASLAPPDSAEKDAFDAAYSAKFGEVPGTLSPYTWSSFDAINALMLQAAKVAVVGDDGNLYIPRGAYVQAVRGMKEIKGISGEITCTDTGECNASGPLIYMVVDGRWEFFE